MQMVRPEIVRRILQAAVQAPSGDNSQPWQFRIDGPRVQVLNVLGGDATLYNFRERGSLVAHGAVIENIAIAAPAFGWQAQVSVLPEGQHSPCTAAISFSPTERIEHPLYPYVAERVTNRKPYDHRPLNPQHRQAILAAAGAGGGNHVRLAEEPAQILTLARAVSLNERLILENQTIHSGLFSAIRWTEADEQARPGLFIRTLELAPPQRLLFRLFQSWSFVTRLNKVGLSAFLPTQSAKLYGASSAIGLIVMPDDSDASFLEAGRIFERLWLTATSVGVSLQPITAIAYLAQRVSAGAAQSLAPLHQQLIREADQTIRAVFQVPQGTIAMIFRLGYGASPSARSRKRLPQVLGEASKGIAAETPHAPVRDRAATIGEIIQDLRRLAAVAPQERTAIEENVAFFEAAKTIPSYVGWLASRGRKLEGQNLRELTDFSLPRWDAEMHTRLIAVERRRFPGLIRPLVARLARGIRGHTGTLVLANFGCGGMEVERQVLAGPAVSGGGSRVIFIGFDKSPAAHRIARENLSSLLPWPAFYEVEHLDHGLLQEIVRCEPAARIVILAKNNLFLLRDDFPSQTFDVVFHSLFKHHLADPQQADLDATIKELAKYSLEYDGYRSWLVMAPQTVTTWRYPVLLGATIFSDLRYRTKAELRSRYRGDRLTFFPIGTYLREPRLHA
ncbi:nitroreductase family protein [Candidatus Parcubacteria bacterium]|nr:nitroreductase family protein [Candidatus Parcubacteria bacterium]